MSNKDFASIYRESGKSFKEVASESEFVDRLHLFWQENGALTSATVVSYQTGFDTRVGGISHVLIFDLEFERGRAKERMVLERSAGGQMNLWDLRLDPARQ